MGKIIILSGVASGHSGSARLISQWVFLAEKIDSEIDFIYGKEGTGNPLRWLKHGEYLKAVQSPFRRKDRTAQDDQRPIRLATE